MRISLTAGLLAAFLGLSANAQERDGSHGGSNDGDRAWRRLLERYDTNRDGVITHEDFRRRELPRTQERRGRRGFGPRMHRPKRPRFRRFDRQGPKEFDRHRRFGPRDFGRRRFGLTPRGPRGPRGRRPFER